MLGEEPLLNPQIRRCLRVPDGSADSFKATHANVASAQQYGAKILNYHEVKSLLHEERRVTGAICLDLVHGEEITIQADMVVNASGAWAGKIVANLGIPLQIIPGKGVMVATNHRLVHTIVNRCHMPGDGDILVPAHTVSVMGTTDVKVTDPDHFGIEAWEVELMLREGEMLVPGFKDMRMLRAWAGVRPLYQESNASANRDVTRAFVLLDHSTRDGIEGLVTITSGKWTTYRKMAEVTVDLVCQKLGVERTCRTHLEELPDHGHTAYHQLGQRLAKIEKEKAYGQLVCECELATRSDIEQTILEGNAQTLDDIRRDVRLGMGPCQAGFCSLRASGILHELRPINAQDTNSALIDFLQERWKGVLPVLWGQQLRQERLNELIYRDVLNADHLPLPEASPLQSFTYEMTPAAKKEAHANGSHPIHSPSSPTSPARTFDVIVIGAGLAGLFAAWQASQAGKKVLVISKGRGATHWHSGCIDVLGYRSEDYQQPVRSPRISLEEMVHSNPQHPYALLGEKTIQAALEALKSLCEQHNYPLVGNLDKNWLLPTALGSARPTCLAPTTMMAGDLDKNEPMLLVGFSGYHDFYPKLAAANINLLEIPTQAMMITTPSLEQKKVITARYLAEAFDQPKFQAEVAQAIQQQLKQLDSAAISRIGFPAVLGMNKPTQVLHSLEDLLGKAIFEIPTLPPSIPGMRLQCILVKAIEQNGGQVFEGWQVTGYLAQDHRVQAVLSEAAARQKTTYATQFILASGGFLGGGFNTSYHSNPYETIFDLPLAPAPDPGDWFKPDFLGQDGHPLYRYGVQVDQHLKPVGLQGESLYPNLFAVGGLLNGCDSLHERSLEGIALASGYAAGKEVAG